MIIKRALPIIFFTAFALAASAQNNAPRVKDFAGVTDSLQVRLKRRMGVENSFRLEKVTARGKQLDFYYSQNLSAYPWRPGDVTWFRDQLRELGAKGLGKYTVGTVYAKRQNIAELPIPAMSNDGQPVKTSFRTADPAKDAIPLVRSDNNWEKGLSGRHIGIWHSHGRYWEESTERWEWQRSATHRTVEDLYTQSYVIPFLMPMLENAGAVVLSPRERDPQTNEVVCDNDESFPGKRKKGVRTAGQYSEKGSWSSAGEGFADKKEAYSGTDNPFLMGTARKTNAIPSDADGYEAEAVWRPDIPQKGAYAVYVSYKTLPESSSDARYTVHHLAGETLLHVNQKMGGGTWIYLGTFPFAQGTEGYVSLTNRSSSNGVITADAVRFGGGMGKVERDGDVSGMPAYAEGAVYNYQYSGIDMALLDKWEGDYKKDISARGTWVNQMLKRNVPLDLTLAFHSDAGTSPNDSIVGTLAIYTLRSENSETFPNGESRLVSRLLADWVQSQIVDDVRALYDPLWSRRDVRDRSYSECRLPEVPSMILELLSHQNFADMRYGLDPQFRFTVSRSVYKAILKFISARYNVPYVVQPLPVHRLSARLEGSRARLSWSATTDSLETTAAPLYYKVYTRRDDSSFDMGMQIKDTTCVLPVEPGHVYSYLITACNDGGESFPSEILAVGKSAQPDAKKVVIVNNFTRVSAPVWFDTPLYAGFTDDQDSGVPWGRDISFVGSVNQFNRSREWTDDDNPGFGGSFTDQAGKIVAGNTFDFVAAHGRAVLNAGYSFESSSVEAFDGTSNAFAADIICGKQVTTRIGNGTAPDKYSVFPVSLQDALREYTKKGGSVLISGSYIGTDAWDGIYQGVPKAPEETRTFVKEVLGYKWVTNYGDYSGVAMPVENGSINAVSYNRLWSSDTYRVENPDGILPASAKSKPLLRYLGTDIPAATFYDSGTYRAAAFGFPLETSEQMGAVIKAVLKMFAESR